MTPKIRIYNAGGLVRETSGVLGETLLQCISATGVFLDAQCGGMGKCKKCRVQVNTDGKELLACRAIVSGDMDVYLPYEREMKIANTGASISADVTAASTVTDSANSGAIAEAPFISAANVGAIAEAPLICSANAGAMSEAPLICPANKGTTTGDNSAPTLHARLGVAIDIGTTTVVVHLTDIAAGTHIATASGGNAQRAYGADVISRIQYCAKNGHEMLTGLIREQLASLIRQTCTVSGERVRDIGYISIAGNTIMEHLAAGYSPVGIGIAPFTPVSLFGAEIPAWEGFPVSKSAGVYFAPAISSYVGGDVTAGMLAAGFDRIENPAVYIDIGTNGEIVLKSGDIFYCCAAAAGPAFEGAEISMGMAAVHGAINHVKWDGGLKTTVIGDTSPRGICGSGLLDALAVLLETGAVDETGRLLGADEISHEISAYIHKVDGQNVFLLSGSNDSMKNECTNCNDNKSYYSNSSNKRSDDFLRNNDSSNLKLNVSHGNSKCIEEIYMTAMDIRKLQLAKSAIAAGIQTLLRHAGVQENQVKSFVLAGGFGSFLDQFNAARIGMFPKRFLDAIQAVGNTAGEGAALALRSQEARERLEGIRKLCKYIELSTSPEFNEQFVEQMTFPSSHTGH